jgi:uncharacterized protein (DUF2236 family)
VLLLGGGRALLLQLAHPLVSAGVSDHSDFRADPLGRLRRTLDAMLAIVFGDRKTALGWAARVGETHARVRGVLPERAGPFRRGTRYEAGDPDLLLWVHATLIDTSLLVYRLFFGDLDPSERTRYYDETKTIASLMGIPDRRIPPTPRAFDTYVNGMLRSETLTVTETARDLASAVLRPPVPLIGGAAAPLVTFLTVALLPERLRAGYALPWGAGREAAWRALVAAGGVIVPRLPILFREFPQARRPPPAPPLTGEHPR